MLEILEQYEFKHIRTLGNKKEYERTIGKHKLRVRPSTKTVTLEYQILSNFRTPSKTIKTTRDEALEIIKSFVGMSAMYG